MPTDFTRLIAKLARDRRHVDLKTLDLCFLLGLHQRAERETLASFEEDSLIDLFEQISDSLDPGMDRPRQRAAATIQRLRDQRVLARVDGAGVVRAGEYALTRLATGIVDFFLADEVLTRESLTLLTAQLNLQLAAILAAAKGATTPDTWQATVTGPLQVSIGELVRGIERRQRGLDAQQEEIQTRIVELLQSDWFAAVDRCQDLLDQTAATLRELNAVLMRDTSLLIALLQEIQALALAAGAATAEAAAQRVIEHIDRIAAWGGERQRAWSTYYQSVHRFLRDVVRLDPSRALSQRLREQLQSWSAAPLHLVVAAAEPIRLLRPMESRVERPPVLRLRAEREGDLELVTPEDGSQVLEAQVAAALAAGTDTLAAVTAQVLSHYPPAQAYLIAGRVAHLLARWRRTHSDRERPWQAVSAHLEVEDWTVLPTRPATQPEAR